MDARLIERTRVSAMWLLGTSVCMFLPFHCFSPAGPIMRRKLLRCTVRGLGSVVFGSVGISFNDLCYVANRTTESY